MGLLPPRRRGRGEGTVFYREDKKKWYICLSLGLDQNNKRKRKTEVGGLTKADALRKLRERQADIDMGRLTADNVNTLVSTYLDCWLARVKPGLAGKTWDSYASVVEIHLKPRLGKLHMRHLKRPQVEEMLSAMEKNGLPPATRKKVLAVLGRAIRNGQLIPDPTAGVARPLCSQPEMKVRTLAEVQQFLKTAVTASRLEALFHLAIDSGARQGEILALQWDDIDWTARTVRIARSLSERRDEFTVKQPKTASSRRLIRLTAKTIDALRRHQARMLAKGLIAAPVFCTLSGKWFHKRTLVRCHFEKIVKAAKVPLIRFHDLRHTSASLQLAAGVSLKALAARLGHAKTSTTLDVYVHLMPGEQEQCVQALEKLLA